MKPVREFFTVSPTLRVWQGYNPEVKVDCTSTAVRTSAGWMLIDPIPLQASALRDMLEGKSPRALILTSANHERMAGEFRDRFGLKIHAPAAARPEVRADVWYRPGDELPGGLRAIELAGAALGETALLHEKVLILGDALIHLDALEPLPPKYCEDRELLLQSLGFLLDYDFETICFSHGLPILRDGKRRLREALAST